MIKKTMTSLFLGLFVFSCSDLQEAAKTMKDIKKNIIPVAITKLKKWYISTPTGLTAINKNGEMIELTNKTKIASIDFTQ